MKTWSQIHPNYLKAYRLELISTVLGLVYPFLFNAKRPLIQLVIMEILTLILGGLFLYFIRKGSSNVKYFLLVLTILGTMVGIASNHITMINEPIIVLLNIISTILSIWILILLFKVPQTNPGYKTQDQNGEGL